MHEYTEQELKDWRDDMVAREEKKKEWENAELFEEKVIIEKSSAGPELKIKIPKYDKINNPYLTESYKEELEKLYPGITKNEDDPPPWEKISDKKIVFICSPFRQSKRMNIEKAKQYCQAAIQEGFIPIAPHLYFPQFIDESENRNLGMEFSKRLMSFCDELWVCGDKKTDGMLDEAYHWMVELGRSNIKKKFMDL